VWDLVEPSTERCIAPLAFVGCVSGLGGSRAARTHCLPTLPGMPSTYNSNPRPVRTRAPIANTSPSE
jgi:hypothetical protein